MLDEILIELRGLVRVIHLLGKEGPDEVTHRPLEGLCVEGGSAPESRDLIRVPLLDVVVEGTKDHAVALVLE